MANVNDVFFDGQYQDVWRAMIPSELTRKETEFISKYFDLSAKSRVLDIMCGYGRHAIALAEKGVSVTAVDSLKNYVNEIREVANNKKLPIETLEGDVMTFETEHSFDLALCMGNSLNFFGHDDLVKLLKRVNLMLKLGASLLINTWSLAEIALKQFAPYTWEKIDNLKLLFESKFLFFPTRIETVTTIISPDGRAETKNAVDFIFSIAEMETILNLAGFQIIQIFGIPGQREFRLGDPRAYIVCRKMSA